MLTRQFCQQLNCLEFAKKIFLSTTLMVLIFRYFTEFLIKSVVLTISSGRSRGGPPGGLPPLPLFWVKEKKKSQKGRKAGSHCYLLMC